MKLAKYAKAVSLVLVILSLLVVLVGLCISVCTYVGHLSCHGCSSHNSHPLIELMIFSPFACIAVTLFGVSRIILSLSKHAESKKQSKEEKTK